MVPPAVDLPPSLKTAHIRDVVGTVLGVVSRSSPAASSLQVQTLGEQLSNNLPLLTFPAATGGRCVLTVLTPLRPARQAEDRHLLQVSRTPGATLG